jgi:hypothetical protein
MKKHLSKLMFVFTATIFLTFFNCSKDENGTQCGEITYLGQDDNCPNGFIITVNDGTTIMSRCVEESALNGLELGDNYCLFN